jgi:hypothetical protein
MKLWPRMKLQIGWSDLAAGAVACIAGGDKGGAGQAGGVLLAR